MKTKTKLLLASAALIGFFAIGIRAGRTDIAGNIFSFGTYRGQDAWKVDSNGNMFLYVGDYNLSASSVAATGFSNGTGGYPGYKVRYYNGGTAVTQGMVLLASNTVSSTAFGIAATAAVFSTTTVLGVADGTVAGGAYGYMTVAGYAQCLTTGTVVPGNLLVSVSSSTGYGGATVAPVSGTEYAVALATGQTAGGLTFCHVRY